MDSTEPDKEQEDSDITEITYFSQLLMIAFSFFISLSMLWPNSIGQFSAMISQSFYIYFIFSLSCFGYVLILFIKEVTLILDKKYKWEDGFLTRLGLQLTFGGLAAAGLLVPIYYMYLYIVGIELGKYMHLGHIPFVVVMLNMMYGFYYYVKLVHVGLETAKEGKLDNQYRNYFTVQDGFSSTNLDLDEIAYIHREGRDIYLKTFEGINHPLWLSLDDIEKELDPLLFFRANRRHIISRTAFVDATKNTRKGLDVYISHDLTKTDKDLKSIELSRQKVKPFKSWLNEEDLKWGYG